ncbi:hypothetical protein Pcinc_014068 [Petrolisthes cinctipes]|uniref:UBA domain-containing protein n=1 Tax=Petrolisthes cinctipes TaxID=88211 RepID=A0AAE1KR11_PETCI|nr:hypothetical protein Pcinc_014068 [Petrolisthes cinctipes]
MLEGLATWVLNNYLGTYLENLNTDQLSIGLLKGEVELENVPLRKDALRHLDMPLEVRTGFVGRVRLQIPVSHLRSEPWVIMFEQLYLVAGPIKLEEYDEEAEEAANQARKIAQLDVLEAGWRAEQESRREASHYASSYSSWLSYGTSFITNIIENIQLKIRDVHLRYEDDRCLPGQVFSCGLTVDSLALQSTDEHWTPRFVSGVDSKMAFKLLELNNMGIYWDTSTTIFSESSLGELASKMQSAIGRHDHEYVLSPVSATACVKRNLNEAPLKSRSSPRLTCDLKLDKFPLSLSDAQYRQAVRWSKEYDRLEKARHYRKWRPGCTVKENPNEWWQFPIQCHLDQIRRKYSGRNWTAAGQRARDIIHYVRVYSEHLSNPATVPTEHKAHKLKVEQEMNFNELQVLREIALARVTREMQTSSTAPEATQPQPEQSTSPTHSGEGLLQRWFPTWTGWHTTKNTGSEEEDPTESTHETRPQDHSSQGTGHQKGDGKGEVGGTLEEEILYVLSDTVENNTFMKRDAVFCQLSFTLKQSTFTLSTHTTQDDKRMDIFELELASVRMALESRPRSKSYKIDIELGSLILRDKITQDTAFPLLVSPQTRTPGPVFASPSSSAFSRPSTLYARLTSMTSSSAAPAPQVKPEGRLFSLTYECRPFNVKADHRLAVKTNSLDIVYNPSALDTITTFFTIPYQWRGESAFTPQMTSLTTAARKRYEELKEQTKQEIKRNWEQIMEGELITRKRWDILLDISAPQIIIPEHFQDKNATLVVLDFGKLMFSSARPPSSHSYHHHHHQQLSEELDNASDDDDEFATPCSTPDEMQNMSPTEAAGATASAGREEMERGLFLNDTSAPLSEAMLHQKMYDKYDLRLCDMQVLVGRVRDNWRFAYQKGTGQMHVLDRFSINLEVERRVVMVRRDVGQQWPSLTLAGTLPRLVVHINEQKVQALYALFSKFFSQDPITPDPARKHSSDLSRRSSSSHVQGGMGRGVGNMTRSNTLISLDGLIMGGGSREEEDGSSSKGSASPTDDGKLVVFQFTVDKLSLELQSRGRSIAELQVTGVRAHVSKRPQEFSATLSVHSLLLVDALQTFGPDFELLVASHKHVSMDSVSGSLLDSDPCSPTSPASPDHNNPPFKPTSPHIISHAISSYAARAQSPPQNLRNIPSPPPISSPMLGSGLNLGGPFQETRDTEALISLEVTYVSAHCPSQQGAGALLLLSVQFNTLDIIANQETVVELVGFIHQLLPNQQAYPGGMRMPPSSSNAPQASATLPDKSESTQGIASASGVQCERTPIRAEVGFDFHKLTVLLLRGAYRDKDLVGRKVGTAVLSDAKIQATLESDILTVEGSLGGFQVRDVTPEGNKHQCIISVGQDPIVERSQDLFSRLNNDVYQTFTSSDSTTRAFSFTVIRPLAFSTAATPSYGDDHSGSSEGETLTVNLRLASVCYTHSPHFLLELRSCATEFKRYMAVVASSIKHAATEMAMGLVSKRIESIASLASNQWDTSPRHQARRFSVSRSTDTLNLPAPPPASVSGSHFSPAQEETMDWPFSLNLDIILETPVVVVPESLNCPDVLVAHLGQISISNVSASPPTESDPSQNFSAFPPSKVAEYRLVVRDMSLFSLNVEERLKSRDTSFQWFHPLSTTVMSAEELYSCKDHGCPILHSTTIEFHLRHERAPFLLADHESGLSYLPTDFLVDIHPVVSRDSLQVDGGIVTPLKISVSRQQYRQVNKTLSNISIPMSDQHHHHHHRPGLGSLPEEVGSAGGSDATQGRAENTTAPTHSNSSSIAIRGSFSVPSMCVELRGDVGEREKPLVNLLLEDIRVIYESSEPFKTVTQVTLHSLMMEDLQQSDLQHKYLMKSESVVPKAAASSSPSTTHSNPHIDLLHSTPTSELHTSELHPSSTLSDSRSVPQFISTSCPEFWQEPQAQLMTASLPSELKMEKPFFKAQQKPTVPIQRPGGLSSQKSHPSIKTMGGSIKSPVTPPPSPNPLDNSHRPSHTTLVSITMTNIDERCPDFHSHYNGTHRFIDVDFNSLTTVVNVPSWVMVLDFFSTDNHDDPVMSPPPHRSTSSFYSAQDIPDTPGSRVELNSVIVVQVRSLTLVLNHTWREVARASVSQVEVRSVGSSGNLFLNGRLGSLALHDTTHHGRLYPEKFVTSGSQAMTFEVIMYGHEDPGLLRKFDIQVKLKMASVIYVHTQRFSSVLTQLVQQFTQLRDIVSRWRATSAGKKVSEFNRGSRLSLDISAGSPVILLPMSSCSQDLLVADLGSLTINNKFLWAESEGTISQIQRQNRDEGYTAHRSQARSTDSRSRSRSRPRDLGVGPSLSDSDMEGECRQSRSDPRQTTEDPKPHRCLLDVMNINLVNMNIYTSSRVPHQMGKGKATDEEDKKKGKDFCKCSDETKSDDKYQRTSERNATNSKSDGPDSSGTGGKSCHSCEGMKEWTFGGYSVVHQGASLLQNKCALKLQVERNLDTDVTHAVPDWSIYGTVKEVHASITTADYRLIRGLLAYNLGEPLPPPPPPTYLYQSHPHHTHWQRSQTYSVWTSLMVILNLDNVTLELNSLPEEVDKRESGMEASGSQTPLACVNFIRSKLTYESFSDESKDVDLVSEEILISDTRFKDCAANKRSNVFTDILQPTPMKSAKNSSQLQAEVHFRSTRNVSRFTILLNNMRLMGILDWWMEVLDFIYTTPENPFIQGKDSDAQKEGSTRSDCMAVTTPILLSPVHTPGIIPSPTAQSPRSQSPTRIRSNTPRLNPMVESTGVMTKHTIIMQEETKPPFELKLNITDSELVVVENTAVWDTSAVILKSTAVISYRPQHQERPLSCNLNQCELYSCILGLEDDTALSIIDPVTVNIEINDRFSHGQVAADIANASLAVQHTVEVVLHQLNIRLSYHDIKMFKQILESVPKQRESSKKHQPPKEKPHPANFQAQVDKLSALGFQVSDCTLALEACEGRLDDAALWLTHNAQPLPAPTITPSPPFQSHPINFDSLEVKTGGVNICIIDDCGDCDVPLLELSLAHLGLKQEWKGNGSACCSLSVDYYNRALSGWEPFLEPWQCQAEWHKGPLHDMSGERLSLDVTTNDTININVTNSVLDLYSLVSKNWTQDYYERDRMEGEVYNSRCESRGMKASVTSPQGYRRRSPFIPFALKNDTGCDLSFTTITATPDSLTEQDQSVSSQSANWGTSCSQNQDWTRVPAGDTVPFTFESRGRGKQRHRDTHTLKAHQLLVRVDGWDPVGPVTVDKVGVFFRLANPQTPPGYNDTSHTTTLSQYGDLPKARVIVAVSLEGSARKLITVRSALLLTNLLHCPVDIRLENTAVRLGDVRILQIASKTTIPVPLVYSWARLFVRPISPQTVGGGNTVSSWLYCNDSLHWLTVLQPNQVTDETRICPAISTQTPPFRFCVHVKRDNFPQDTTPPSPPVGQVSPQPKEWVQPGHNIVIVSPLTLVNLLPYDMHYEVRSSGGCQGRVKPGEDAALHVTNPSQSVTLALWTDTFLPCGEVTLHPSSAPYLTSLKLEDSHKRGLYINLKVCLQYGSALKVVVNAAYWLMNKTGLPLIFKQEGASSDAAGQDQEHEVARCGAPLLFSFTDRDASPMLVARVGNRLHPECRAQFCHKLPLTQTTWVRRLRVSPPDTRPDHVYIVGVDIRAGHGRYQDTYMVTFSPRFQIENRSSHELLISQSCFTTSFTDPSAQSTWLRAISGCWLPFHWPRIDKEQLLSVCLRDVPGCYWCGGFAIDNIDSFYLNLRDNTGRCYFMRVEIIINDATYFIVFTDADSLPPPFRIDNFSEVPVTFYQTKTQEERLRTSVKPRSCVAYAWDEVTLPPYITCMAPGGTSATYNMNILGDGARLTYENFIYVAFTGTFRNTSSGSEEAEDVTFDPTAIDCQQLVLDVPEGTRVRLGRKEAGRRSQLWRMTTTGMLQHEGSSPPHDPTSKKPQKRSNILVLDIAGPGPQPNEYVPLMLRKPDDRRSLTQTWRFTDDGRLCCKHYNMFVQAKDGFLGLQPDAGGSWQLWNDVVLGPPQLVQYGTMSNGVPVEQAVSRQRLRPGSGLLAIRVVTDGPTRVLQVTDVHSKNTSLVARTESGDWVSVTEEGGTTTIKKTSGGTGHQSSQDITLHEVQMHLRLHGGLGVSLVQQSPPQELCYAKLTGIICEYQSSLTQRSVDCSVKDIQIDNQLTGAQCPVVLYVTPQSKTDDTRHLPAIYINAHQVLSTCTNAYIFKDLLVSFKNLTVTLEDSLVFRVMLLAGCDPLDDPALLTTDEHQYDTRRMLAAATSVNATRYYFTKLELNLNQVRLSVLTSKKLTPELKRIKRKMGLTTLVRFENANVNLEAFVRCHPFETQRFLVDCITKHYREELKSQAVKILGSTDFLGNPFGLLHDVTEGVSELVHEGSVGGLVWNVTHGMANSTAKVTGSLSDAVGRVTMDSRHEEYRQRLRTIHQGSGADHMVAGLRGLGLGIYGGLTSIVSQTYTGASQEGFPGLFSGFAKGVVGTVTKPAIGLLDLASSTSLAVRDSSKHPSQKLPCRIRLPRLVVGLDGMLPRYCKAQATGQELLFSFHHASSSEIFLGYEVLREGEEDLRILISSEQVRVFSQTDPTLSPTPVLSVGYRDLHQCKAIVLCPEEDQRHYIELTLKAEWPDQYNIPQGSDMAYKRPKVRCDSHSIAKRVAQQINYARNLHEELRQTLLTQEEENGDD